MIMRECVQTVKDAAPCLAFPVTPDLFRGPSFRKRTSRCVCGPVDAGSSPA